MGIGTDLVAIARLERAWQRHGERFARRLLSGGEWDEFQVLAEIRRSPFLAKRFAAKEAAAKALGTGFRFGIGWRQIEVSHDSAGKPILTLHLAARERFRALGGRRIHLSLSDTAEHALAFVVLES